MVVRQAGELAGAWVSQGSGSVGWRGVRGGGVSRRGAGGEGWSAGLVRCVLGRGQMVVTGVIQRGNSGGVLGMKTEEKTNVSRELRTR